MPPPLQVDLKTIDLESGVRVTCDVDFLCGNFSLPRPRVYFKRGVQPKCGVQNKKMWSPKKHLVS